MIRVLGKGLTAQAIKKSYKDVVLYDDNDFNSYDLKSNDITIVSPGIPPYNEMIKKSINLQSDYDFLYEDMPFSIWISGTNGKTTTTQMCQHLLEERKSICGGNIGTSIALLNKEAPIWILETSSFTLHYTNKAKPKLYILLPISEDHISWHGSYEEYKKAKLKPLDMMIEGEIAIIPKEFENYPTSAMKIVYENSDDLCSYFNIDKSKINFKEPFLMDALLALAVKKIIFDEIDYRKINSFKVDSHKVEEFYDKENRLWIDDSKATNIDATIKALSEYKEKELYLILGGDDKGANLKPLFEVLKNFNVEIFAIGTNCKKIYDFCTAQNTKVLECQTLDKAVDEIAKKHHENSIAILSPAAASLDQFTSYKERGEKFKTFVSKLS
jgi:UDP-N-acetylmuramoylalanine--D-glutamate ligase